MKLKSAFFIVLLLCGVFVSPNSNAEEVFRVMSFNVLLAYDSEGEHSWDYRKEALTGQIREVSPVLFGVQEALPVQMEYLHENLADFASIGVGRDDGANSGEYSAVFYDKRRFQCLDSGTFWLSETPEEPSYGWDAMCRRIVTWGIFETIQETDAARKGTKFLFASTHFDHKGETARQESAKMVTSRLAEKAGDLPIILVGDFNSSKDSATYRLLTEATAFRDTSALADDVDMSGNRTYHDFGNLKPGEGSVIDYIFIKGNLTVPEFHVCPEKFLGRYTSDHCAIYAELVFPREEK
ncbi:MAG: endonuclease/exonuclease/phosphatase family protein [Planctomycetia bacterium]|nr:endonuclease/exonuclease/phosphatase family protein [Planctomycetia bacterium]